MKQNNAKHFFNMVEVALALLVISLGLSTVLTLFPAGLKATREAENANNVVEAAEYIFSYLQTQINEQTDSGIWDKIKTTTETGGVYTATTDGRRIEKKADGIYLYHKAIDLASSNGYVEDFSCVARILKPGHGMKCQDEDDSTSFLVAIPSTKSHVVKDQAERITPASELTGNNYFFLGGNKVEIGEKNKDVVEDVVKIVDVELSYPATDSYQNRQKRTFRMVLLNPKYEPYPLQ